MNLRFITYQTGRRSGSISRLHLGGEGNKQECLNSMWLSSSKGCAVSLMSQDVHIVNQPIKERKQRCTLEDSKLVLKSRYITALSRIFRFY